MRTLSENLFQTLQQLLKKPMTTMLQNLEKIGPARGAEAWARIHTDALGDNGPRMMKLADEIFYLARVKLEEVPTAVEAFIKAVIQFESSDDSKISPTFKIFGLGRLLPTDLATDYLRQSSTFSRSFLEAKKWVLDQVVLRRKAGPHDNHKSGLNSMHNVDSHDHEQETTTEEWWNNLSEEEQKKELLTFVTKGKGKGKGVGGGFPGNCDHCGKYGHRMRDCRIKDAEMAAWRAGTGAGKADQKGLGKGQQKGKGLPKGFQKGNSGNFGKGGYGGKGWGKSPMMALANEMWTMEQSQANQTGAEASSFWGPPGCFHLNAKAPEPIALEMHNMFTPLEKSVDEGEEPESPAAQASESFPPVKSPGKAERKKMKRAARKDWVQSKEVMLNAFYVGGTSVQEVRAPTAELMPFEPGCKKVEDGWTLLAHVADTGARHSCVRPGDILGYKPGPSAMSRKGECYVSASGDEIPNEGEITAPTMSKEGVVRTQTWQLAEVNRPLWSIGEECDKDQYVMFGKHGGAVLDIHTGEMRRFPRRDGVYEMQMWIPPPDFRRQS